ncbi:MAG TPA: hypothetical protein GXX40_00445 [Firmicutes bacterium]|nr:hypothetical protein [Bacillota bacterium]
MKRWIVTILGFEILAFGINLTVLGRSAGVDPWNVLQLGITMHSPLTLGQANIAVGVVLAGVAWALGVRPTTVTLANVILVGLLVDLTRLLLPLRQPASVALKWLALVAGSIVSGVGIGTYMSTKLGTGPRDSTMLALCRITGRSISFVRISMEIAVTVVGWLLGGPAGPGTLVSAALLGPVIQLTLQWFEWGQAANTKGDISTGGVKMDLNRIKARLLQERRQLEEMVGNLEEGLTAGGRDSVQELSMYDNHPSDVGSETYERGKDIGLRDNALRLISQVARALTRLDEGTYGKCEECGNAIPLERLEAVPWATLCLECQRRNEGRFTHKRPAEEKVIPIPFGKRPARFSPAYDGVDVWEDVGRYGSSYSPSDQPGSRDYRDVGDEEPPDSGTVQRVDAEPSD